MWPPRAPGEINYPQDFLPKPPNPQMWELGGRRSFVLVPRGAEDQVESARPPRFPARSDTCRPQQPQGRSARLSWGRTAGVPLRPPVPSQWVYFLFLGHLLPGQTL